AVIELKGLDDDEEFELELDDEPDEQENEDDAEWLTGDALSGTEADADGEEDLFSPDDFPVAENLQAEENIFEESAAMPEQAADGEPEGEGDWALDTSSHAGEGESGEALDGPSDEFGGFSAVAPAASSDEEEDEDLFGDEDGLFGDDDEALADEEDADAPKAAGKLKGLFSKGSKGSDSAKKKKSAIPFLSKKTDAEDEADDAAYEESAGGGTNTSAFSVGLLVPALIGFVLGALILGVWGVMSKSSLKKELQNTLSQGQDQTQIQAQNAQLQQEVQQQTQEIESLKQQVADASAKGGNAAAPQSISPSPVLDSGSAQVLATVLSSFETLKNTHIQTLGQSYETQQQASCVRQVLLDGEGTSTNAQVVKKFSTKYTAFDVRRSDSLVTPFVAELKIPFKQEMRAGQNEKACNAAALKELPTPKHHEFGNFYGIWIVEYQYKDGKWVRKPTVRERNRALYEKAFNVGSPDYAKFLIDDKLYPGFNN
ncbi:MAG: hypothetical protein GY801_22385, partial [bacterium]|nr:hypothetical protein [bacterium]